MKTQRTRSQDGHGGWENRVQTMCLTRTGKGDASDHVLRKELYKVVGIISTYLDGHVAVVPQLIFRGYRTPREDLELLEKTLKSLNQF